MQVEIPDQQETSDSCLPKSVSTSKVWLMLCSFFFLSLSCFFFPKFFVCECAFICVLCLYVYLCVCACVLQMHINDFVNMFVCGCLKACVKAPPHPTKENTNIVVDFSSTPFAQHYSGTVYYLSRATLGKHNQRALYPLIGHQSMQGVLTHFFGTSNFINYFRFKGLLLN